MILAPRRPVPRLVRMAEENPTWGSTRIRGALRNVAHGSGRSTIARILKTQGMPPVPERPTSWRTFLRTHDYLRILYEYAHAVRMIYTNGTKHLLKPMSVRMKQVFGFKSCLSRGRRAAA